jgi:nicotinamidase/pyrazinamidase
MDALLIVDVQNDFVSGSLAVPEAEEILEPINRLGRQFDFVVATRDWHPPDHVSFADNHEGKSPGQTIEHRGLDQQLWPEHCVRQTWGAQLADGLDPDPIDEVVDKGTDPEIDSYSAFFDNGHIAQTGLADLLADRGVERIWVAGLATDVCVRHTVLDARRLGFAVELVVDACRGVDVSEGDSRKAIEQMAQAGAHVISSRRAASR